MRAKLAIVQTQKPFFKSFIPHRTHVFAVPTDARASVLDKQKYSAFFCKINIVTQRPM